MRPTPRSLPTPSAAAGVPHYVEKADVAAHRAAHRLSLEQAAREVRYAFLARVYREHGADAVALGHTADDQAETILMHVVRGSGLTGLRGMEASVGAACGGGGGALRAPAARRDARRHRGLLPRPRPAAQDGRVEPLPRLHPQPGTCRAAAAARGAEPGCPGRPAPAVHVRSARALLPRRGGRPAVGRRPRRWATDRVALDRRTVGRLPPKRLRSALAQTRRRRPSRATSTASTCVTPTT